MDSVGEQKEEAVNHCERRDFAGSLGSRPCDPWSIFSFLCIQLCQFGDQARFLFPISPRSQPQELTDRFFDWDVNDECTVGKVAKMWLPHFFSLFSLVPFQRRGAKTCMTMGPEYFFLSIQHLFFLFGVKACYSLICTRALPERFTPARRSFLASRVSFLLNPDSFSATPAVPAFFCRRFCYRSGQDSRTVWNGGAKDVQPGPQSEGMDSGWISADALCRPSSSLSRAFAFFFSFFFVFNRVCVYCSLLHPPPVSPRKVTSASSTLC